MYFSIVDHTAHSSSLCMLVCSSWRSPGSPLPHVEVVSVWIPWFLWNLSLSGRQCLDTKLGKRVAWSRRSQGWISAKVFNVTSASYWAWSYGKSFFWCFCSYLAPSFTFSACGPPLKEIQSGGKMKANWNNAWLLVITWHKWRQFYACVFISLQGFRGGGQGEAILAPR